MFCRGYILLPLVAALLLVSGVNVYAQHRNDGCDLPRTPLIPYATAADAASHRMDKQRYMQPISEWTADENDVLHATFTYPFSWVERQVFIRVEALGRAYELWVNGKRVGASSNGYVAAEYNATKQAKEDKNSIELRLLDSKELKTIECFEQRLKQPAVYVMAQPRVRVRDVACRTDIGVGGVVNANFSVIMCNQTLGEKQARLYYELYMNDTVRLSGGHRDVTLGMYGVDTLRFGASLSDSVLWSRVAPTRLSLRLHNRIGGRDVEFYDLPVALREIRYEDGDFWVNGTREPVEWHELSPDADVATVASLRDAGCRYLRFTAGVVSDDVLDYCDAVGLYVAVTAPINSSLSGDSRRRGGNPSNNPSWTAEYVSRITSMIHTTKRHPSVVAYFLADDSANGIALYEGYLAARRIAGERPIFYDDGNGEWNSDK